jgi:hypothetical protein
MSSLTNNCQPSSPLPPTYKYITHQDKQINFGDFTPTCRSVVTNETACQDLCDKNVECTGYNMSKYNDDTSGGGICKKGDLCCTMKKNGLQALQKCYTAPPGTLPYSIACTADSNGNSYGYKDQWNPDGGGGGISTILWIVIIALLLAVIGFGIWYYKKHNAKIAGGRTLNHKQSNYYGY